jgi:hypothetical protein
MYVYSGWCGFIASGLSVHAIPQSPSASPSLTTVWQTPTQFQLPTSQDPIQTCAQVATKSEWHGCGIFTAGAQRIVRGRCVPAVSTSDNNYGTSPPGSSIPGIWDWSQRCTSLCIERIVLFADNRRYTCSRIVGTCRLHIELSLVLLIKMYGSDSMRLITMGDGPYIEAVPSI